MKFKVRHIPMIEVYPVQGGFKADVFDPAWGKVYETVHTASRILAIAKAKDACRKTCGDVIPNVFDVERPA